MAFGEASGVSPLVLRLIATVQWRACCEQSQRVVYILELWQSYLAALAFFFPCHSHLVPLPLPICSDPASCTRTCQRPGSMHPWHLLRWGDWYLSGFLPHTSRYYLLPLLVVFGYQQFSSFHQEKDFEECSAQPQNAVYTGPAFRKHRDRH